MGVWVAVGVGVRVGEGVALAVGVCVLVGVGVAVGLGVLVALGVPVGLEVGDALGNPMEGTVNVSCACVVALAREPLEAVSILVMTAVVAKASTTISTPVRTSGFLR